MAISIEKQVGMEIGSSVENLTPGTTGSKYAGFRGDHSSKIGVDRDGKLCVLVKVDGWHQYSRRYGAYIARATLIMYDSTKRAVFQKRVPASCEDVESALAWMEGAAVQKARVAGKKVLRQGDVYFIPQRTMNLKALQGSRHKIEEAAEGVIVTHPEHKPIALKTTHKAVMQKNLQTRFGGGVGAGD